MSKTALLLIDFINPLEFDGAESLQAPAVEAARSAAILREKAGIEGIPVLYVNDHFGDWTANFPDIVERAYKSKLGAPIAKQLAPHARDISVLKPRHSAFYGTPVEFFLSENGIENLILTGLQTHICILFTAHDAFLRKYRLWVPPEAVASESYSAGSLALRHMHAITKADIRPASNVHNLDDVFDRSSALA